ncbi:MAG: hypothetical protein FWH26_08440 [Oscillospiraceae bacterium]|nr:hypothetical protein [Oscillospiraceae bacterium]
MNEQEFLRLQEQAVMAAREMQRRAALPLDTPKKQQTAAAQRQKPQGERQKSAAAPKSHARAVDGLHHACPSQQARHQASYGRTQPPLRNQESGFAWREADTGAGATAGGPAKRNQAAQSQNRQKANENRQSAPPPMIPDMLRILGQLGGTASKTAKPPNEPASGIFSALPEAEPSEAGMDLLLVIMMLLMLQQENADQGLLLALMYIMM